MAQFPWKKGKRAPTIGDLNAEMDKRFNTRVGQAHTPQTTGNVQVTPPVAQTKPRTIRNVGKTGYKPN